MTRAAVSGRPLGFGPSADCGFSCSVMRGGGKGKVLCSTYQLELDDPSENRLLSITLIGDRNATSPDC